MIDYSEALRAARNAKHSHANVSVYMRAINQCVRAVREYPNDAVAMDLAEALSLGFDAFRDTYHGGISLFYIARGLSTVPDRVADIWEENLGDERTRFLEYFGALAR